MAANAVLGGVREAGAVLGPLLGGVIVAAGGVRAGLTVDGLTFLVSVPLLARAPRLPPSPRRQRSRLAADAWAGLRYTLADPVTRALAVGFFLAGLAAADDVALPFLARTLDAGAPGIGELYAALGAGLILGYVALNRRNSRLTPIAGILLGSAVAATGNLLTGPAPAIAAAIAFQAVRGLGLAVYETTLQTTVQRTVPSELLGRVFANLYGAVNVAACAGLLAGGPLLDATSARTVLVAAGAAGLAGTAASGLLLRRAGPSSSRPPSSRSSPAPP